MKDQFIMNHLYRIEAHIKTIREHIIDRNIDKNAEPKTGLAWWSGRHHFGNIKPQIVTPDDSSRYSSYRVNDNWVNKSELRFVGDEIYWDGIGRSGEIYTNSIRVNIKNICANDNELSVTFKDHEIYTYPDHLSTTPIEPKRPEPKFAKGQMTDKGKVDNMFWGGQKAEWVYEFGADRFYESELTTVPSIKITLFKVVDGKVETVSCPILDINGDKDECAEANFKNGFCAILIEQDGIAEWKPCPELKAARELHKNIYDYGYKYMAAEDSGIGDAWQLIEDSFNKLEALLEAK